MESGGEERSGEPRALRMSGDPGRESLAGAQRGAEGRRRRWLKLHGYVRTLTFTQPPNICCCLLIPPSLQERWKKDGKMKKWRDNYSERQSKCKAEWNEKISQRRPGGTDPYFFCRYRSFNGRRNKIISRFIGFCDIVTNEQGPPADSQTTGKRGKHQNCPRNETLLQPVLWSWVCVCSNHPHAQFNITSRPPEHNQRPDR